MATRHSAAGHNQQLTAASMIAMVLVATTAGAQTPIGGGAGVTSTNPEWSQFQHDMQRTSRSSYIGPIDPVTAHLLATEPAMVIAVGPDRRILLSGNGLTALNPDGSVSFKVPFIDPSAFSAGSLAVADDGTIYVGTYVGNTANGALESFTADGTPRWRIQLGGGVFRSPPAVHGGVVYLTVGTSCFQNQLVAIRSDGTQLWDWMYDGCVGVLSPAVAPDGTVLVTTANGFVQAHDPITGIPKWAVFLGGIGAPPSISPDGIAYIVSDSGRVLNAVSAATGTILWGALMVPCCFAASSNPAIAADGSIVVASAFVADTTHLMLKSFTPSGTFKWARELPTGEIVELCQIGGPQVTLDGAGNAYVSVDGGCLAGTAPLLIHAVSPDGAPRWSLNAFISTTAFVGAPNVLYAMLGLDRTGNQQLYALTSAVISPPTITDISPRFATQGTTLSTFTVTGSNLDPSATLSFSGTGITVEAYSSRTSTQIVAGISIAQGQPVGPVDVIVTNPDGQGARTAGFEVLPRCTFAVTAALSPVSATCGAASITITTDPACHWFVTSNIDWLQPSVIEGTGSASVRLSTAINQSAEPRIGSLSVADKTVFVEQLGQLHGVVDRVDPTAALAIADSRATKRSGVAADGVARLVLRLNAVSVGTAAFALVNDRCEALPAGGENGGLTDLTTPPPVKASNIVTHTDETAFGIKAFAIYRSPARFVRPSFSLRDAAATERAVFVRVQLHTDAGGFVDAAVPIKIIRPPVILIHGLWSDPTAFDVLARALSSGPFHVDRADYEHCPDDPLGVKCNSRRIPAGADAVYRNIRVFIREFRLQQDVAAIQADLVAHSMGALIARHISTRADFFNDPVFPTFGTGSIHRLISVDAPHLGSNIANLLISDPCLADVFTNGFELPTDNGAIDDLQGYPGPRSQTIRRLDSKASSFPAHTIVGLADPNQKFAYQFLLGTSVSVLLARCAPFPDVDTILGPDNDLIVSDFSQRAGQGLTRAVTTFDKVVHSSILGATGVFGVLDDPRVAEFVAHLLDADGRSYLPLPRVP